MKDIDRYDDEVMRSNADEAEISRKREKRAKIKRRILFGVKLFVAHIVALIFYFCLFSTAIDAELVHETGLEDNVLAFYSTLMIFSFSLVVSLELMWNGDERREYKNILKTTPFSATDVLNRSLDSVIPFCIIYFAFQIPGAIFHHIFGYSYTAPIIIDSFYTMDMGFMELTNVGFLGALINTVLFAVFLIDIRFCVYLGWKREKDRFDGGEKTRRRYG